jgi:hypothetical protein
MIQMSQPIIGMANRMLWPIYDPVPITAYLLPLGGGASLLYVA